MATITAHPEAEPTLYDVIQTMQAGFEQVDRRFDAMNAKLEEELQGVKRRLFKIELKLEDKGDTLQNHEERIGSLERWRRGADRKG